MNPNELRIGNLVRWADNGEEVIVTSEHFDSAELLEGVPITREWIVSLGLKNSNSFNSDFGLNTINEDEWVFHDELVLYPTGKDWELSFFDEYDSNGKYLVIKSEISYIHQLQNLYFALTGEEIRNASHERS